MTNTKTLVAGANAGRSRTHNRRVVLGHIRREGTVGRAELGRRSGLSTQAVSNIIAELEAEGLIETRGTRSVGRGLPAAQYGLCPQGAFALGYEIRPDAVFISALGLDGEERFSAGRTLSNSTPGPVLEKMRALTNEALGAVEMDAKRLIGAGVVMPGPFDVTGLSDPLTEIPAWRGKDMKGLISDALDLPVFVENDANAAAMAERVSGVARALDAYVFLYFGSGLGLGIISEGRLDRGGYGNAGEIGHIPIVLDGCSIPLEAVVSRVSLRRHLADAGVEVSDGRDLSRLYDGRDPALLAWLERASQALAQAVQIIENLFDPEAIILGGAMPDQLLDHLIASTDLPEQSVSNRPDRRAQRLLRGGSGRMTATRGAAALVLNQTFTPQLENAVP